MMLKSSHLHWMNVVVLCAYTVAAPFVGAWAADPEGPKPIEVARFYSDKANAKGKKDDRFVQIYAFTSKQGETLYGAYSARLRPDQTVEPLEPLGYPLRKADLEATAKGLEKRSQEHDPAKTAGITAVAALGATAACVAIAAPPVGAVALISMIVLGGGTMTACNAVSSHLDAKDAKNTTQICNALDESCKSRQRLDVHSSKSFGTLKEDTKAIFQYVWNKDISFPAAQQFDRALGLKVRSEEPNDSHPTRTSDGAKRDSSGSAK